MAGKNIFRKITFSIFMLVIVAFIATYIFNLAIERHEKLRKEEELNNLIKELKSGEVGKKRHALFKLCFLGKYARDTGSFIIQFLNDNDPIVRGEAADTLGCIQYCPEKTIPLLINMLSDSDPFVRQRSIEALATFGNDAKDAIPKLINLIKDPKEGVRFSAISAIVMINNESKEDIIISKDKKDIIIPALISVLNDPYEMVRAAAIGTLGLYGCDAKEAIPLLVELLNDKSKKVRLEAALAIKATCPHVKNAIDMINDKIKMENNVEKKNQLLEAIDIIEGRIEFGGNKGGQVYTLDR